jgi:hypothetical protein
MDIKFNFGSKTVLSNGKLSHRKYQNKININAGEIHIWQNLIQYNKTNSIFEWFSRGKQTQYYPDLDKISMYFLK